MDLVFHYEIFFILLGLKLIKLMITFLISMVTLPRDKRLDERCQNCQNQTGLKLYRDKLGQNCPESCWVRTVQRQAGPELYRDTNYGSDNWMNVSDN